MSATRSITAPPIRFPILHRLRLGALGMIRRLDNRVERWRIRGILAELTDDQLRDIGLSRSGTGFRRQPPAGDVSSEASR